MSAVKEFDVGPLTWVKSEIDQALERARTSLAMFAENPSDGAALKFSLTHLHQATGALQMVGLDGLARFSEEFENTLAALEKHEIEATPANLTLFNRAIAALTRYLEELVGGEPNVPLRLFPLYQELFLARGSESAAETDLFFPDLGAQPPKLSSAGLLDQGVDLAQFVKTQRRAFQRGLLRWLRDSEDVEAKQSMLNALRAIEGTQPLPAQRSFWWSAVGLIDALVHHGLEPDFELKRLCARIDLQLRRLGSGSPKVAERLLRDVLYAIARSKPTSGRTEDIKRLFQLDRQLPSAGVNYLVEIDLIKMRPILRELRDILTSAKDAWTKFTSGNRAALPQFAEALATLRQKSSSLNSAPLLNLLDVMQPIAADMESVNDTRRDEVGLEIATALLVAENALDNITNPKADIAQQVGVMVGRLRSAVGGKARDDDLLSQPVLDEISRKAQEKLLVAQVVREIQSNLRHIEQVLDTFFRDPSKRDALPALRPFMRQVAGALAILRLEEATELLNACQSLIDKGADPAYEVAQAELELLADGLSSLGFYIEAIEHNQSQPEALKIIAPVFSRLTGKTLSGPDDELAQTIGLPGVDDGSEPQGASVESDLANSKQQTQALFEAWQQQPEDVVVREELQNSLESMRQDADLVADKGLHERTAAALDLLNTAENTQPGLAEAISQITAPKVAAIAPSEQATRMLVANSDAVDAELLEIYLEEAAEVLATIEENLAVCRAQPNQRDAITTIRRSFHTLKGSGRMVGLMQLGEVGWSVEQVMNEWLQQDKLPNAALFELISLAHDSFAVWVTKLKNEGSVEIEAQPIHDLAAQLRDGAEPAAVAIATPIDSPAMTFAAVAAIAPAVAVTAATTPVSAAPDLEDYTAKKLHAGPAAEAEDARAPSAMAGETGSIAAHPLATPETADQQVEASVSEHESEPLAVEIQIGEVVMSAELYEIFMKEAEQHLATLEREAAQLHELPQQPIGHDFMRATHTLAGSSRTAGVGAVVELAFALELYLQELIEQPVVQNPAQISVIDNGVVALQAMMQDLRERRAPQGAGSEIEGLRNQLATAREQHRPVERALAAQTPRDEIALETEAQTADAGRNSLDLALSDLVLPQFLSADSATDGPVSFETPSAEVASPEFVSADLSGIDPMAIDIPASDQMIEEATLDLPTLDLVTPSAEAAQEVSETLLATEPYPHDIAPADTSMGAYATAAESGMAAYGSEPDWPVAEQSLPEDAAQAAVRETKETPVMEKPAHEPKAAQSAHEVLMDKAPLPTQGPAERAPAIVERRVVRDDIDVQLLPIFLEEAAELVPQIGDDLRVWKREPTNTQAPLALRRALHTLKGGARMAGAMRLGELTHNMESQVDHALETSATTPSLFDDLESEFDRVNDAIERLQRGDFLVVEEVTPGARAAHAPSATAGTAAKAQVIPIVPLSGEVDLVSAKALLRIRADIVDRLVNDAGEVSIARSRIDGEVRSFKNGLNELTDSVLRLRGQLREVEIQAESQLQSRLTTINQEDDAFDPLEFDRFTRFQELTRLMAESLHDVTTVQQTLLKSLDEADAALLQQARMNRELQQELMRIRTVPFSSMSERLYRIMRLTAKELGKKANLEICGGSVELDRSVLEKIGAPLEHMMRNAIAHGLEGADARAEAGKTEIGEITLDVRQQANEILIVLSDDGRGLDLARIRNKAEAAGLLQRDTEATEAQLMEFIFMPGFSTAEEITQTSGRGIGMEVARNEVATLGGRVEVASQSGRGTTFSIYLPLTLAVTQTVLIRIGTRHYAIPSSMIEQVQELKAPALALAYKDNKIEWHGNSYPFYYLPRLLGDMDHSPETMRYSPILLLKSGIQRVAIHVDGLIGNQEIVVKNIGPQLARVTGIAGATVLGTGLVVLIINPVQLAQRDMMHLAIAGRPPASAANAEIAKAVAPLIMVVDDSLTVRKITGRLLAREGYQVVTAKDGVDALKQLQDMTPDVMLVDIEMPRMDGFDLTKNVRADPVTARVPIIMITSRTADKHRNHAMQLGVDVFLGKPFQEADLLHHIERFTKDPRAEEIESLARAG
ncbi:MAG: Hpt domain-containing protein [Pseudomonadota bacterium]|nr:Hpt domain-containing protein [Pseudomonadota bacterium]